MPSFSLSRSTHIAAPAQAVHAMLDDFQRWREWSPWEDVDPNLTRTYSGPQTGLGAHYAWSGNSQAGSGTMEIVESTPETVDVALEFLKPFKASNRSTFRLAPSGGGTGVTWTMSGHRNLAMSVLGKLYFNRAVGKDFERGLAALKARAES